MANKLFCCYYVSFTSEGPPTVWGGALYGKLVEDGLACVLYLPYGIELFRALWVEVKPAPCRAPELEVVVVRLLDRVLLAQQRATPL